MPSAVVIDFVRTRITVHRKQMERKVQTRPPDFIQPTDLTVMTDEQIDLLLEGIRVKRMQSKVLHDETMKVKEIASRIGIETKLSKKLEQLSKAIDVVDKQLAKMEGYANEIRAHRMQLGLQEL